MNRIKALLLEAIDYAAEAIHSCRPNPSVACIIIKDDKVVAKARHQYAGGKHAEILALEQAGDLAKDSTCILTLEPCSHTGKTGPCTKALIKAGVAKVFIGTLDPNPLVAGRGIKELEQAGIEVINLEEKAAKDLIRDFYYRMYYKRPYTTLKLASTLDGRIALNNGKSKWLTGKEARLDAHLIRAINSAILTTDITVMLDDPAFTVRNEAAKDLFIDKKIKAPIIFVLDKTLSLLKKIAEEKMVLKVLKAAKLIFVADIELLGDKKTASWLKQIKQEHENSNILIEYCKLEQNSFVIDGLNKIFCQHEINSLLIEAGGKLAGKYLKSNLVDEIIIYYAGKIIGDKARASFVLPEFERMDNLPELEFIEIKKIASDLKVIAKAKKISGINVE